jgi:hypothetical protein
MEADIRIIRESITLAEEEVVRINSDIINNMEAVETV